MSDVADVTIDETEDDARPSSSPGANFPEARGDGYDVSTVDTYIDTRLSQVERARSEVRAARMEAAALRDEVAKLAAQLAESDKPTYAGLGWFATEKLERAETEADSILAAAAQAAADIAQLAERDAQDLRADTKSRVDPGPDIEQQRTRLYAEAEQDRKDAKRDADQVLDDARRKAEQVRAAAQAEADAIRDAAGADAEKLREGADQEVTAGRKVLELERERAATDSSDAHRSASERAEQLSVAMQARVLSAEERAHATTAAATQIREQAQSEAEQLLGEARREAAQLVESARVKAEAVIATADADGDHELINARADLIYFQRRYHVIAAQLVQLHDAATDEDDAADE